MLNTAVNATLLEIHFIFLLPSERREHVTIGWEYLPRLRYYLAPLYLFIVSPCPCRWSEIQGKTNGMRKDHTQHSSCKEISSYYLFKFLLRPALVIFNGLWRDFFPPVHLTGKKMHSDRKRRSKDTWWICCWTSLKPCDSAQPNLVTEVSSFASVLQMKKKC